VAEREANIKRRALLRLVARKRTRPEIGKLTTQGERERGKGISKKRAPFLRGKSQDRNAF